VESVIEQYLATVRPMHMQFVEPSKRHADVIIPEGGHNLVSIDLLAEKFARGWPVLYQLLEVNFERRFRAVD
jgi:uridine kinase